MKTIMQYVDQIEEELHDGKKYAESYIAYLIKNEDIASRYKEMTKDELKHAKYIVEEVEEIIKDFSPPKESSDRWDSYKVEYENKVSWIEEMLQI